jgi:pilus assembly protein CpaF
VNERAAIDLIRERVWSECDHAAILAAGPHRAPHVVAALADEFLIELAANADAGSLDRTRVINGVVAATLGFGPIQSLLEDPSVSEIMVNGPHQVFVERDGVLSEVELGFDDDDHVLRVIDRILAPIGRRVDAMSPMVDARLADGSRVNAIIPPLSIGGPTLTIRRFVAVAESLDDLVRLDTLEASTALELERLVAEQRNVLVSGGTSTGKTTLLAACLAAAAPTDRLVVLEDAAELPLRNHHAVRLESRAAAAEGAAPVTMRDLVKNALRMRPDRIILGEVRGVEAWDLLQALNTGHGGSWSTIHANGPEEALLRLESMVLSAGTSMPHAVVRDQVGRAVDAVVQLERLPSGKRVVTDIVDVEVVGSGAIPEWRTRRVFERGRDRTGEPQ